MIAQQIAEHYPEIVKAGASALAGIDNLVVLNGGAGMADLLAQAMTMGGAGFGLAKQLIATIGAEARAGVPGVAPPRIVPPPV